MLGAAGRDDDDRRADPLVARGLDQLPAVEAREHQVEDADVGLLVAEPGEPLVAVADRRRRRSPRRRDGATIPCAITSSSSTIRTFGMLSFHYRPATRLAKGRTDGEGVVNEDRATRSRRALEEPVVVLDSERRLVAASPAAPPLLPAAAVGPPADRGDARRAARGARPLPRLAAGALGVPGAPRRLHRGRLARAADAARPPARPARERDAARSRRRRARSSRHAQEVEQARELIDDVLFLGELETGREVVTLGRTHAAPVVDEVVESLHDRADHAEVRCRAAGRRAGRAAAASADAARRAREPARERDPLRGPGQHVHGRGVAGRRGCRASSSPTTARASPQPTCRACSSASTAATRRERAGARGSASRSSSTSSPRPAGEVEATCAPGQGLEIRARFPRA